MSFPPLSAEKLKHFRRFHQKKFRKENKVYLIDGDHLFQEFLRTSDTPLWIAVTTEYLKNHPEIKTLLNSSYRQSTFLAHEDQMLELSDTEQPQGIVAALKARMADIRNLMTPTHPEPVLVLDRIADPGNLGTMIRCADWFGVPHIVMNSGCVEWYNPKVVRGSMGSIFRVNGYTDIVLKDFLMRMKKKNYRVYAAVLDFSASYDFDITTDSKTMIVIGNEAEGIHPELIRLCSHRITIPRYGQAESLNAAMACGILLNQLARKIYPTILPVGEK